MAIYDSPPLAAFISQLLGIGYITAWGVSFYPQLIINVRRKSVTGLALDFFVLNVFGFLCYTISSLVFLFSPVVRDEYRRRHHGSDPTVRWNDLAFGAHALFVSCITLSQFFLWGYERLPTQRLSAAMRSFLTGALAVSAVSMFMVDGENWMWIDVVYTLQWIKLIISVIKYVPQAYLNFCRKSTVGWSIHNILLDLTGGTLSLAQLVLDSSLQNDWSGLTGNPIKFWLAQISILFDFMFIAQHYVLYRHAKEVIEVEPRRDEGERRGLLA